MIPSAIIDHAVPALELSTSIHRALDIMDEFKLSHLPVVRDGKYLGYLSEEILLDAAAEKIEEIVFAGDNVFTTDKEPIYTSVKKLADHQLSALAVLDNEEKYIGMVTVQSIFLALSEISAVRSKGGVFSLRIKQQDYSLFEISRILETNGYKILSVELLTVPEKPLELEVVIKVNTEDLSRAFSALERQGYVAHLQFGENVRDFDNQERLNLLFKFLDT